MYGIFKAALILILLAAILSVGFGAFLFLSATSDIPTIDEITNRRITQSTKVFDRTGEILLYEISAGEKRTVIPFEEIPSFLKDATIVIEDESFYEGPGFNWRAIIRALWSNFVHGRVVQGGSTITQQLAKNAFLTSEQTLARKIKEFMIALQLSRHYSKDEILHLYLNEIPYGPTLYGIEAASRAYFGKPARDLNLAESAILAALPKAPSYYSPYASHVEELINRQQYILKKMLRVGKIDDAQLEDALNTKITFLPQSEGIRAPHFVIAVQEYLVEKYGEELVRTGGLKVITTLDYKLQELGEKVVREGALRNEEQYKGKNAALVLQDAVSGQILALIGSRDYFDVENEGNFNVATQGLRQPGSALKPFAYLTAFKKGYSPETVLFDVPTEFVPNNPKCPILVDFSKEEKECFHPQNFDEKFRGPVSLRNALAQSINIPSVKVLYLAQLEDTLKTLHDFGVTTLKEAGRYGLSLVLGGGEVKLIDLVGAYSGLAQEGVRRVQTMILEIKDGQGEIIESYKDQGERVADAQYARLVNDILSDTSARASLFQASLGLTVYPGRDVALKTGTTNDYRDAWAISYTPSLVAGVWAGNNDNTPMERRGGSILAAVPILNAFMKEVLKDRPVETFGRPETSSPQKPVMRGDYAVGNQIHSILYYVDRRDPNGPYPTNPENDSQFLNWETPVLEWAKSNIPDFEKNYNQAAGQFPSFIQSGGLGAPQVQIQEPKPGAFVKGSVSVVANITALSEINKVRVYLNNNLIEEVNGSFGLNYGFRYSFSPQNLGLQNLLRVEATDRDGRIGKAGAVVYK